MSNKQSSVEWLIEKYTIVCGLGSKELMKEHIERANKMHKEEMIEFAGKMQIIDDVDFDGNVTFIFNPEQNYNETFGGDKNDNT